MWRVKYEEGNFNDQTTKHTFLFLTYFRHYIFHFIFYLLLFLWEDIKIQFNCEIVWNNMSV